MHTKDSSQCLKARLNIRSTQKRESFFYMRANENFFLLSSSLRGGRSIYLECEFVYTSGLIFHSTVSREREKFQERKIYYLLYSATLLCSNYTHTTVRRKIVSRTIISLNFNFSFSLSGSLFFGIWIPNCLLCRFLTFAFLFLLLISIPVMWYYNRTTYSLALNCLLWDAIEREQKRERETFANI